MIGQDVVLGLILGLALGSGLGGSGNLRGLGDRERTRARIDHNCNCDQESRCRFHRMSNSRRSKSGPQKLAVRSARVRTILTPGSSQNPRKVRPHPVTIRRLVACQLPTPQSLLRRDQFQRRRRGATKKTKHRLSLIAATSSGSEIPPLRLCQLVVGFCRAKNR
jgi:hypothetical protein